LLATAQLLRCVRRGVLRSGTLPAERMSRPRRRPVGRSARACSGVTGHARGDHASNENRRRRTTKPAASGVGGWAWDVKAFATRRHQRARTLSRSAEAPAGAIAPGTLHCPYAVYVRTATDMPVLGHVLPAVGRDVGGIPARTHRQLPQRCHAVLPFVTACERWEALQQNTVLLGLVRTAGRARACLC
jgi:hypothetical protein